MRSKFSWRMIFAADEQPLQRRPGKHWTVASVLRCLDIARGSVDL
jgi:hypothetical protein